MCVYFGMLTQTQYAIIKILTEYVGTRFKNIDNEVFNLLKQGFIMGEILFLIMKNYIRK